MVMRIARQMQARGFIHMLGISPVWILYITANFAVAELNSVAYLGTKIVPTYYS